MKSIDRFNELRKQGRAEKRKLQLWWGAYVREFACYEKLLSAVAKAEQHKDGEPLPSSIPASYLVDPFRLVLDACENAHQPFGNLMWDQAYADERYLAFQSEIWGPEHLLVAREEWLTPDVRRLAETALLDQGVFPILADALEEAGAADEMVLHCHQGPAHFRGCWVLDLLEGKAA